MCYECQALPPTITQIQAYRVGPDAGLDPAKFDIAIVGDFPSPAAYKAYGDFTSSLYMYRCL